MTARRSLRHPPLPCHGGRGTGHARPRRRRRLTLSIIHSCPKGASMLLAIDAGTPTRLRPGRGQADIKTVGGSPPTRGDRG
jgi:hypothetical protein